MTGTTATEAVEVGAPATAPKQSATGRSLEGLFIATLALFGFRVGARPIHDNSTLAHLRTGLDMAHGHGIPRRDPYSYTALGHRWVVQSWLPEWTYGWAYRLGGGHLLVLEQGILTALLALLIARLARAGSAIRTAAGATVAVWAGANYWSPRPLLFGLVFFALTMLVVERRRQPWLLIPIVWAWVNSHGSFPLGLLWLGAVVVGEAIDTRRLPVVELRYLGWFIAGLAVSAVNPLGPRLLLFPLTVGNKQDVFKRIVEWRSPDFQSAGGLFTLMGFGVALLILTRARTRWRYVLPVIGFILLGLYAVRNLSTAAIVLAPALGAALRAPSTTDGSVPAQASGPRTASRRPTDRMFAAVIALGFVVMALVAYRAEGLQLVGYPVAATNWIDSHGLRGAGHNMAEQDVVGDYLIWRDGAKARVFVDDRYDMYPTKVSEDAITLIEGTPGALDVLDCRGIDVVLWDRHATLAGLVMATGQWSNPYHDKSWGVFVRTTPVRTGPSGAPLQHDGASCPNQA